MPLPPAARQLAAGVRVLVLSDSCHSGTAVRAAWYRGAAAASILLISGCQDNQLSADGEVNGLFTGELLRVWRNGAFKGSYPDFHRAIVRRMPPDQTPNYFRAGRPSAAFEGQRPFTV